MGLPFDDDGVETRHRLTEQTLGIWHGALPGVAPGTRYGFRVAGPGTPRRACGSTEHKLLLDPYARAVSGDLVAGPGDLRPRRATTPRGRSEVDSGAHVPRSVVVGEERAFDWGGDRPLRRRWRDTVIYELHVKGLTALHDRVPEQLRGTYAGPGRAARSPTTCATSASPPSSCCRCTSSSREPLLAERGAEQLLGLQLDRVLRPAPRLLPPRGDRGEQVTEFKQMVGRCTRPGSR